MVTDCPGLLPGYWISVVERNVRKNDGSVPARFFSSNLGCLQYFHRSAAFASSLMAQVSNRTSRRHSKVGCGF